LEAVKIAPLLPNRECEKEKCIAMAIDWFRTNEGIEYWSKILI